MKVLAVEWDYLNRLAISRLSNQIKDIELFEVNNGLKALEFLKFEIPNIIILDIFLEKIGGIQLCEIIKVQNQFRNTLIIGISGYYINPNIELLKKAGFDYFFTRPLNTQVLIEEILNFSKWDGIVPRTTISI